MAAHPAMPSDGEPGDGVQPYLTRDKMAMACSFATTRRIPRTTGTIRALSSEVGDGGMARVLPGQSPSLTVTNPRGLGPAAVGRLVGRVLTVSLCDVCFLRVRVWHPYR